jgi:acetyl-CoA carboxylase carboxyltransferase component
VSVIAASPPAAALGPRERLLALADHDTLQLLRTGARSRRLGAAGCAGDGVLAGQARVDGRLVFCYAQDPSYAGGSLGEAHAETIAMVLGLAERARSPLICFVQSGGARLQEGVAALCGYGRMFHAHVRLSGLVPQISIVCGPAAGGSSYGPALTDFVIMSSNAAMFLTGPTVVEAVMGERIDAAALGGPSVHERNGVCHFKVRDDSEGAALARKLLGFLPQHAGVRPARSSPAPPSGEQPERFVPAQPRRVYDIRDVARALVDGGSLLEVSPRRARNIVCALARFEGMAVGIVANQPRYLGGVLDAEAAQKGARFVRTCDAFGLPLVVLVDTPGFLPGGGQERCGVIRDGAKLVHAFAHASVPSVTVVLRKAFGGAFIAMNCKSLGADYVFAWPQAQIGVMGAEQAVGIIHRRELLKAQAQSLHESLAGRYASEHLGVEVAAAEGAIDEVIAPVETRERIIASLESLRPVPPCARRATNMPL